MRFLRKLLNGFSGKYDVMAYARRENRPDHFEWYAFLPSEIYPATILRILEVRRSGEIPEELIDEHSIAPHGVAMDYMKRALAIPEDAFELNGADRGAVLELARLWFTQALRVKVGKPIGIHILKDEAYRL